MPTLKVTASRFPVSAYGCLKYAVITAVLSFSLGIAILLLATEGRILGTLKSAMLSAPFDASQEVTTESTPEPFMDAAPAELKTYIGLEKITWKRWPGRTDLVAYTQGMGIGYRPMGGERSVQVETNEAPDTVTMIWTTSEFTFDIKAPLQSVDEILRLAALLEEDQIP